jgi:uncharacterized protein (DUF4415 family)
MGRKDKKSKSSWVDPDDAPEWSDDVFERAELRHGDKVVRAATGTLTKRGRPKLENPKRQVTLRLDGDVLDRFRASGAGWQVRINEALRKAVGL